MRLFIICVLLLAAAPAVAFEIDQQGFSGQAGANPFDSNSTANNFGADGNPFGNILNDPDSTDGSPYSGESGIDPDAPNASKLFGSQSSFWSRLSIKPLEPDSASKPYGRFGNTLSSDSINNPYGAGNPYAPNSPANPYFGSGSIITGR